MPDYKKLDEIDVVFVNKQMTVEERKLLSEYLKRDREKNADFLKNIGNGKRKTARAKKK